MLHPSIPPTELCIGVDCSGQPNAPPMIAVATRLSKRGRQVKWVAKVREQRINVYSRKYSDWQEKLYAALFFTVINRIFASGYKVHIDKELPSGKSRKTVLDHLSRLFGIFFFSEIQKRHPDILFTTDRTCKYVKEADKKAKFARHKEIEIDEKDASVDHLMKLL